MSCWSQEAREPFSITQDNQQLAINLHSYHPITVLQSSSPILFLHVVLDYDNGPCFSVTFSVKSKAKPQLIIQLQRK